MAYVIHAPDIINFDTFPAPMSVANTSGISEQVYPSYHHPKVGTIKTAHFFTPYMHVSDIHWQTTNDVELHSAESGAAININFIVEGAIDTDFEGLPQQLNMRMNEHNLVYAPDGSNINRIRGGMSLRMFHISIDREYFSRCLGDDNSWSGKIQHAINSDSAVLGNKENLLSSKRMLHLIQEIRSCSATGPMRSLLLQSRMLELLSLQIEQFSDPVPLHQEVRQDDAKKLYQLRHYLDANFLCEVNLGELSRICLLNEFKLKRGFKLLFGTTVFNYLRKLRMEYAGNLLRHCALNVEEVADALGYEHAQHFSVAFKKYMGISPSVYQTQSNFNRL